MAEIIIDKWYGREETDLINKNTFDKVEFQEQITDVVGGEVLNSSLWLFEKTDDQAFKDAGFSTVSKVPNFGTNTHIGWGDSIETDTTEMLGNCTIRFKNKYGDQNVANYSVEIKCVFRRSGSDAFLYYSFLKGSLVTPSDQQAEAISGEVLISFSGDNIILTLNNMLLYGDYYVRYNDNPEYNEKRSFRPWYWTIKVVYGGLQTRFEKVSYGDGEKSIRYDENTLIERHSQKGGTTLSEKIASEILAGWKDGKKTIKLSVPCGLWKNGEGNHAIDIDSDDESVPHLICVGDIFSVQKMGKDLFQNTNGTNRRFIVTRADFFFDGKPKMTIDGVELK